MAGLDNSRPQLAPAAHYGLAGKLLDLLEPHTEADPAALLLTFLAMFGNLIGPIPHAYADGVEHPARLNVLVVGKTSRSRKGTSEARIREVLRGVADRAWFSECRVSGLSTGEGLIARLRDPDPERVTETEKPPDKRCMVFEPEFARVLKVAKRDGSTLSHVLRDAWDRGDLDVTTRSDPLRARDTHISVVAHITREELLRDLDDITVFNGFANRFALVYADRSKRLPQGSNPLPKRQLRQFTKRLRGRVAEIAREFPSFPRLTRTADAERSWARFYNDIDDERDGLFGAATARAEAHVLRMSVAYALLDGSRSIDLPHLEAALAVWHYCEDSCLYVFGERGADPRRERLYRAILASGRDGLTGNQQRDVFSGHLTGKDVRTLRGELENRGRIVTERIPTSGRPRVVSRAVSAESARTPGTRGAGES